MTDTDAVVETVEAVVEIKKRRIKLTVAYDGTRYRGYQFQPLGPTVEGELKRHLEELLQEQIVLIGGSRTDSGVHALMNIAVFDTVTRIPGAKIAYALNQRLPEDIRIGTSVEVAADFHPRRCASRKTYEYRIWNADMPLPTKRLYHYFAHRRLDSELMRRAAAFLVGEHDFKSFCTAGPAEKPTVRTLYSVDVEQDREEITIRVCGSGFLYHMVRIIAGTLMEVGYGKYPPDYIETILSARLRSMAGPTAPANGLTLVNYEFDP